MQASPEDVVEVLEEADGPVASRDLQYELNLTPHELAWITRVLRSRERMVVTRHHHACSTTTAYELLDSESNDSASPNEATGEANEMTDETSESKGQQVNLEGEVVDELPYKVKTRHTHEWTGDIFVLRLSDKKLEKFRDAASPRRRREIVARSMRVQKNAVPTGSTFEEELTRFVQAVRERAGEVV